MSIITIFDGSYCHGEKIAELVSARLGYERIETRLVDLTSERFAIARDRLTKSIRGKTTFFNKLTHDREKHIASLKRILAEMILEDNRIIYGFEGHLIPRTIPHVLKSCIIANFDYRVKEAARINSVSEKEAANMIRRDDKDRLEWTGFLFRKPPYEEYLYDIVIPTHTTSVGEAVEEICKYATAENTRTTPRAVKAVEDFILASAVELALVEAGHIVEVGAEDGTVVISISKNVMRMSQYESELKNIAGKIEGVKEVKVRQSQTFHASSMNPWANIEVPPKILLVDDEKEFVHTLSERLQTRSLESSIVYDGEQALEFVNKDEPDVMVLDLMMPGIDGIEVLRRVKKQHPDVEVIILTGHGSRQEEEIAEDLGAFAYLNKPVNIDLLARVMNEAYKKINRAREAGRERSDGDKKEQDRGD